MRKAGLTGGIASGKSTVCSLLQSRGCIIIDADKVAHELIRKGEPCYKPVVRVFGSGILGPSGEINRKKLGSIVFNDTRSLETLNRIIHPEVNESIRVRLDGIQLKQPDARVVVDASLMIESGLYENFRPLIVVACTLAQQIERLIARDTFTEAEARKRISLQMPLEQKKLFADYVIDNSGTPEGTQEQGKILFEKLEMSLWTMSA